MSYIGHTCPCGHSDLNHTNYLTAPTCKASGCTRPCAVEPEPTLRPTFDSAGRVIERIVPPGGRIGTGVPKGDATATYTDAIGGPETCDCDACTALHTELTGEAA